MAEFKEYFYIFCIVFLRIIIIFGIVIFMFFLISFNYDMSIIIADAMKIPYDYTLTIISFGFANNMTILLTITEIFFIVFLFYKLNKYKFFNKIFSKFICIMDDFYFDY